MRILLLHSDFFEYTPIKKEIDVAEDNIEKTRKRLEELVVAFISIEDKDNEKTIQSAILEIKKYLDQINENSILLYPYSHLSSNLAKPDIAFDLLKKFEELSKESIVKVTKAPFGWTKSFTIKVKGHPLAENFKVFDDTNSDIKSENIIKQTESRFPVQESNALSLEETQQSTWYVLTQEGNLVPVNLFKFSKNNSFEKFVNYETQKNRKVDEQPPHVKLMKKLAIADYEPASDAGNMRFYPKGRLMKSLIEQYVTRKVMEYGGIEVETPIMYDSHHPSMASYFNRFPARQYNVVSDNKELFLRFAACFGQFLMAKDFQISYKNMPLKLYELTRYSFRREKSGELVGLRRLRAFSMPDCHAFCSDMEQAKTEFLQRFNLSVDVITDLGFSVDDDIEMAIRFTEEFYNNNRDFINKLVSKFNKPVLVEMWKEKFFYFILKWEFNYVDNLGKAAALSTDQIDVENGERYEIEFVNDQGIKNNPIILHNSPSGAIERVIYALLEKSAKILKSGGHPSLPLWLTHTQVRIIPVKDEFLSFCVDLAKRFHVNHIRADIDDRAESVGKRIRDAEIEWTPYILVIGEKEISQPQHYLNVRSREQGKQLQVLLEDLIFEIKQKTGDKPYLPLNLPFLISTRPIIMV